MITVTREDHRVSDEKARYLHSIGGSNPYGEPKFRLVWSQTRTEITGGIWEKPDGTKQAEMRTVLKYGLDPCWVLEKWIAPDCGPEQWRRTNEIAPDVSLLGPYPSRGTYESCYEFQFEPKYRTLALLVPLILKAEALKAQQIKDAISAQQAQQQKDWDTKFDAVYENTKPAYFGPVSGPGIKNKTAPSDRRTLKLSAQDVAKMTKLPTGNNFVQFKPGE